MPEGNSESPPINPGGKRELPAVPLIPLQPTGEVPLPVVNAVMIDPYFEPTTSRIMALAIAAGGLVGLGALLKFDKDKAREKMTRRQFLKLGAVSTGTFLAMSTPGIGGIRNEIMKALSSNQRAYSLFTDFPLLKSYWLREKKGESVYKKRKEQNDLLGLYPGEKTPLLQNKEQVGIIHDFRLRSMMYLQSLDKWAPDRADFMDNTHLMVYELTKGKLKPRFHPGIQTQQVILFLSFLIN